MLVKASKLSSALNRVIDDRKADSLSRANKALRVAVINTWSGIIKSTPVDEGRARGNWFIGSSVTSKLTDDKNKSGGYVAESLPFNMFGKKLFMFNNLPYINLLEFGGYGSKDTQKTNSKGFSKQAPSGMVRINLKRLPSALKSAYKAAK